MCFRDFHKLIRWFFMTRLMKLSNLAIYSHSFSLVMFTQTPPFFRAACPCCISLLITKTTEAIKKEQNAEKFSKIYSQPYFPAYQRREMGRWVLLKITIVFKHKKADDDSPVIHWTPSSAFILKDFIYSWVQSPMGCYQTVQC